jgi:hypothetical protein
MIAHCLIAGQVDSRSVEHDVEQSGIVLVEAAVHEERHYHDELARRDPGGAPDRDGVEVRTAPDATRLGLRVVLSAVLDDGRRVTEDNCLGLGGPPTMRLSEVSELLERMLGRNPESRRPPRLAWGRLLSALEGIGVTSSEPELIAAPLEIRLEPSARPVVTLD